MGCCSSSEAATADDSQTYQDISLSCYPTAPTDGLVEQHKVHHVYDGDTLTLEGGKRVRLVGIDAPEIRERQPYAAESRDFLRALCPKGRAILLQLMETERTDKYGRLLAYVYVKHPHRDDFICVNVAMVEKGLASLYLARHGENTMKDALSVAQIVARREKRKTWENVDESRTVVIGDHGKAFHRVGTKCIVKTHKVTVGEALDRLFSPCRRCKPFGVVATGAS
ncbi:micrococcal nuclease [Trypanosoma grayi]|uniref:micrococcal nuclease n=1 Tax=Trypanosoma grayi TaxID=71804 RepID=UPI0004F48889|nr:micrococcal nuclease [Trypanosoma grayi]KEG07803.1 micrococcal nuclease [Trypanosoma grayi]